MYTHIYTSQLESCLWTKFLLKAPRSLCLMSTSALLHFNTLICENLTDSWYLTLYLLYIQSLLVPWLNISWTTSLTSHYASYRSPNSHDTFRVAIHRLATANEAINTLCPQFTVSDLHSNDVFTVVMFFACCGTCWLGNKLLSPVRDQLIYLFIYCFR